MSSSRKRSRKASSHTARNLLVLGVILITIVLAAVALSTPSPQFFMTVHVYDAPIEYTSLDQLTNDTQLVSNSTVTISGPQSFAPNTTPTGIIAISTLLPAGSYTIKAEKIGYSPNTIAFDVGANCANKQVLTSGEIVCHALIRITKP
jgi:hypothetical protein